MRDNCTTAAGTTLRTHAAICMVAGPLRNRTLPFWPRSGDSRPCSWLAAWLGTTFPDQAPNTSKVAEAPAAAHLRGHIHRGSGAVHGMQGDCTGLLVTPREKSSCPSLDALFLRGRSSEGSVRLAFPCSNQPALASTATEQF